MKFLDLTDNLFDAISGIFATIFFSIVLGFFILGIPISIIMFIIALLI